MSPTSSAEAEDDVDSSKLPDSLTAKKRWKSKTSAVREG